MSRVKPDPSEPYRYCCPDCGTVSVGRMFKPSINSRNISSGRGGWGVKDRTEKLQHKYTCGECSWRGKQVHDKKRDAPSDPWSKTH